MLSTPDDAYRSTREWLVETAPCILQARHDRPVLTEADPHRIPGDPPIVRRVAQRRGEIAEFDRLAAALEEEDFALFCNRLETAFALGIACGHLTQPALFDGRAR